MARSVSTHRHSVAKHFITFSCEDADDVQYEFQYLLEDIQTLLATKFPKFRPCDRWQDREDHVILESGCAEVSISEYNGLVAICLAPLDPDKPLHVAWCEQVENSFKAYLLKCYPGSSLVPQGFASNGEQFFQLATEPGSCVTSKEGRLW